MIRNLRSLPAGMLLCTVLAASLAAQGGQANAVGSPTAMTVVAENITARDAANAGRPRAAAEGAKLLVGDVVEYRLQYTNIQRGPVKNVVLEDPIPSGLVYVIGTASSDGPGVVAEYSIDGGRTFTPRPMVRVMVDGQEVERPAPADRYTNIRWRVTGAVSPGARVTASFRARLGAAERQ